MGEAGLDYYYDRSPRDVQAQVFRRLAELKGVSLDELAAATTATASGLFGLRVPPG